MPPSPSLTSLYTELAKKPDLTPTEAASRLLTHWQRNGPYEAFSTVLGLGSLLINSKQSEAGVAVLDLAGYALRREIMSRLPREDNPTPLISINAPDVKQAFSALSKVGLSLYDVLFKKKQYDLAHRLMYAVSMSLDGASRSPAQFDRLEQKAFSAAESQLLAQLAKKPKSLSQ